MASLTRAGARMDTGRTTRVPATAAAFSAGKGLSFSAAVRHST